MSLTDLRLVGRHCVRRTEGKGFGVYEEVVGGWWLCLRGGGGGGGGGKDRGIIAVCGGFFCVCVCVCVEA